MGIELFERAAEARACILRVEQLMLVGGASDPAGAAGLLLTFDVGRILVRADPAAGMLELREIKHPDEAPGTLESIDDEEPWWRVAGSALTRAWPGTSGTGAEGGAARVAAVRLQFREDAENPRLISLRYEAGKIRVSMEDLNG